MNCGEDQLILQELLLARAMIGRLVAETEQQKICRKQRPYATVLRCTLKGLPPERACDSCPLEAQA